MFQPQVIRFSTQRKGLRAIQRCTAREFGSPTVLGTHNDKSYEEHETEQKLSNSLKN